LRGVPSAKLVAISASAVGEASAAPAPCAARAANRAAPLAARPPASDATVNSSTPAMKTWRRPLMSPARPPVSSSPPKIRVYALTAQDRLPTERCRPLCIRGRAMVKMVASTTSIS
jgi:hypothetical protein